MAETTFTFRVDDALKAAFAEAAESEERTAAQLLRVLMRETVERRRNMSDHDTWFRDEVLRGLEEADASDVARISHGEVRTAWQRQRDELERRATGRWT